MAESLKFFKTVYCDKQFLEDYFFVFENRDYGFGEYNELMLYNCVKRLLSKDTIELFINISKTELEDTINSVEKKQRNQEDCSLFEKFIYDKHLKAQESMLQFHVMPLNDESFVTCFLKNNDLLKFDAIYLSMSSADICSIMMEKYGILVVSPINLTKIVSIIHDSGVAIRKKEKVTWKEALRNVTMSSASIVIIDNYILNDCALIKPNLLPILDKLLLKDNATGINTQVTIVCDLVNTNKYFEPDKRFKIVDDIIKELRPNLKCDLSIINLSSKEFHDRAILTNNLWIGCGAGFDLFNCNNEATKSTVVNIVSPYINESVLWVEGSFRNAILDIRAAIQKVVEYSSQKKCFLKAYYYGKKENRLYDI